MSDVAKNPDPARRSAGGKQPAAAEPLSAAGLKAAITRGLLADQAVERERRRLLEEADRKRRDDSGPECAAPPGAGDGTAGVYEPSGTSASRPGLARHGRHRRVFTDDRHLDPSQPHKHRPTQAGDLPDVKARLRDQAKQFGLTTLPGASSLTLATRLLPGGRAAILGYIRLAASDGDVSAQTWLHVWDGLKAWEQKGVTLDDVCAGAGVSAVKLLKAIVGVAFEAGVDVANLVAAQAHPEVVKTSIKVAKTAAGIEDRKLLYQHHGFTPLKQGVTVNVGVSANATANAASMASADTSVPGFLKDVEVLQAPKKEVQQAIVGELAQALPPSHSSTETEETWLEALNVIKPAEPACTPET